MGNWRSFINSDYVGFLCHLWAGVMDTGNNLAFECHVVRGMGYVWESLEEYDDLRFGGLSKSRRGRRECGIALRCS